MRELYIRLADDLDRTLEADETIEFTWRGKAYEIDLSRIHVVAFEEAIERFVKAARPADPAHPVVPVHRGQHMSARRFKAEARAWGEKNGWPGIKPGDYHPRPMLNAYAASLGLPARPASH